MLSSSRQYPQGLTLDNLPLTAELNHFQNHLNEHALVKFNRFQFIIADKNFFVHNLYYPEILADEKSKIPSCREWVSMVIAQDIAKMTEAFQSLNYETIQNPQIQLVMRAMLTQALLLPDQTDKQDCVNKAKMVSHILETCFAAGYNILADTSFATKIIVDKSTDQKKSNAFFRFLNFLELAYEYQFARAIQMFHEFGHQPLSSSSFQECAELKVEDFRTVSKYESRYFSVITLLAIYYQDDFPSILQQKIVAMINDAIKPDDPNLVTACLNRIEVAKMLVFYGTDFTQGRFNGGTKRLKSLYFKLFGEYASSDDSNENKHDNDNSSAELFFPGKVFLGNQNVRAEDKLRVQQFQELFRDYVLQKPQALGTVGKYQALRKEAINVSVKIIRHIVTNPVHFSKPKPPKLKKPSNSVSEAADVEAQGLVPTDDQAQKAYDLAVMDKQQQITDTLTITRLKIFAARDTSNQLSVYHDKDIGDIQALEITQVNKSIITSQSINTTDHKIWSDEKMSPLQVLNTHFKAKKRTPKKAAADSAAASAEEPIIAETPSAKLLLKWLPLPKSQSEQSQFFHCKLPGLKSNTS